MITITLKIKEQSDDSANVEVTSKKSSKVAKSEELTAIVVENMIKSSLKDLEKEGK